MKSTNVLPYNSSQVSKIMITIKLGTFLALLNETIINVALSRLMEVFSVSANTAQWLTSGYMLVLGVLVPVTAFLIERLSTRQLYLSAMLIFLASMILAACAQSFPMLLAARLLQGVGASVLMPLMMNTVMVLNPPEKRGSAMGAVLFIVLFAPAIGPTYSGLIIQTLSWRWIFIIIIPFAILSVIFGWFCLRNVTQKMNKKMDMLSLLFTIVGFGALLYGINGICSSDSSKLSSIIILLVGILALIGFVLRQLRIPNPLLNIRVFKAPIFSLGMGLITITYIVLFANFVLMPMFIEQVLGYSVFQAGLAVLPGGIIGAVLPPVFGKVYDRFGPRVIVPLGFGIMTIGNFVVSCLPASTGIVTVALSYCLVMMGVATLLAASQTNSLNQLPHENYAHGTATMNTLMMIGSAFGSSVFIALMASKQNQFLLTNSDQLFAAHGAISFAYIIATALSVIGFVLSLFFRREAKTA